MPESLAVAETVRTLSGGAYLLGEVRLARVGRPTIHAYADAPVAGGCPPLLSLSAVAVPRRGHGCVKPPEA